MAKSKRQGRLYWREQGGVRRYYGDFRDYADVGGGREGLISHGKRATTDRRVADVLLAKRVRELEEMRRGRLVLGVEGAARFSEYASLHLVAKKQSGKVTDQWLESSELHLERAASFFGADRELLTITVQDISGWVAALRGTSNGRTGKLSSGSIRHHLNSLSNLFRRAQSERRVPSGFNPAASLMDKPQAQRKEARFLDVHDGALLLEAARLYRHKRPDIAANCVYPLVATLLLTGGRESEVLGLEAADINFERDTITFRPNGWRRVKNEGSARTIRMWPQLKDILLLYVFEQRATNTPLLFPSLRTEKPQMLTDIRKMLDGIGRLAGWEKGQIRSRMCRHTYCSARLQTLVNGHPIAPFDVGRELGHGGDAMVRRVYGHIGQVKHRSEVVEYRVEQHAVTLGERLTQLQERSAAQWANTRAVDAPVDVGREREQV